MLCQVFILRNEDIIYSRHYARGLDSSLFNNLLPKIKQDVLSKYGPQLGSYDFFKYKISYIVEKELDLIIIFVSGLTDNFDRIKAELFNLKKGAAKTWIKILF